VRGIDHRKVQPNQEIKSVSAEDTFAEDLGRGQELNEYLIKVTQAAHLRLTNYQLTARTVTLKIKFADFTLITRSKTLPQAITDFNEILSTVQNLLDKAELNQKKIRLIGVGFSNFGEIKLRERYDGFQQSLFPDLN
jgi:DNA polymerase-4